MRENRPKETGTFVLFYKGIYLILIAANLFILFQYDGFRERRPLTISLGFLVANVLSWLMFLISNHPGRAIGEQVLSLGRIATILCAALVYFIDLIMYLSPVGLVLWVPLMESTNQLGQLRIPALWTICAVLLILESYYLRTISSSSA